jgi:hypothetical protein
MGKKEKYKEKCREEEDLNSMYNFSGVAGRRIRRKQMRPEF